MGRMGSILLTLGTGTVNEPTLMKCIDYKPGKRGRIMDLLQYLSDQALILVPALWLIGVILKSTPRVADWIIPWVLLGISIAGAMLMFGPSVQAALQGILAAGAAVLGHQLVKQTQTRGGGIAEKMGSKKSA